MFQFLTSVLTVQLILQAYHGDLKPKNIFYKKLTNPSIKFHYKINNHSYTVPTFGYLYLLADFGNIQSLLLKHNKLNADSIKLHIKNNLDLSHIIDLHKRIAVNAIEKIYNYNDLIKIITSKNDKYFALYLKNKQIEVNKDLKSYPDKVKNKFLFRSIIYYALENDYINFSELPQIPGAMKLPSQKIISEMTSWKKYESIVDILNTFDDYKREEKGDNIVDFTLNVK
ncbi:MAG: serine/threonine protein kinase [Hyperionvirus sp.]|uniref:Serine/threonine protein kinase n=1 Tax=Hyperionvirus sp. TaxID=2487770 RepID=A0A3G5ADX5_9VIRU|nr:MAG: serine/threonine protein kinase [Hyperionvirus sp.]